MDQREYYDSHAVRFDRGALFARENRNHLKKIKAISDMLGLEALDGEKCRLLEVGTGTGIHARYIMDNFKNVEYVGVDLSRGMLLEAKKRLPGCRTLLAGDGENLPFKAGSFDSAYISGSLHHFGDPKKGLYELARVVKQGGNLLIMEPYWLFPTNLLAALTNKAERGIFNITEKNFKKWSMNVNTRNVKVKHMLYTPPVPERLNRVYDMIDACLVRIPVISRLSIMICLYIEKS